MRNKKLDVGDVIVTVAIVMAMMCIVVYTVVSVYKMLT
jgi:hypothetical protein